MRAIALRNGTFEETHAISAIVSSTTQNKRKDISKFADVLSSCVRKSRDSSLSTHPGVEFVFAEIASTSQTIRTSFLTMLALVWSSGRFLPAKTHILLFDIQCIAFQHKCCIFSDGFAC